jgi:hypothetical protein
VSAAVLDLDEEEKGTTQIWVKERDKVKFWFKNISGGLSTWVFRNFSVQHAGILGGIPKLPYPIAGTEKLSGGQTLYVYL